MSISERWAHRIRDSKELLKFLWQSKYRWVTPLVVLMFPFLVVIKMLQGDESPPPWQHGDLSQRDQEESGARRDKTSERSEPPEQKAA